MITAHRCGGSATVALEMNRLGSGLPISGNALKSCFAIHETVLYFQRRNTIPCIFRFRHAQSSEFYLSTRVDHVYHTLPGPTVVTPELGTFMGVGGGVKIVILTELGRTKPRLKYERDVVEYDLEGGNFIVQAESRATTVAQSMFQLVLLNWKV